MREWRTRRAARRLSVDGQRWERFEATVVVARSYADLAEGEAALVGDCERAGRSVEFVATSDAGCVRIYRIGQP